MSTPLLPSPRLAFITPSWSPDFERCRLLVESVERYVPSKHHHWVFVPRRDEKLFAPLNSTRTHVVVQEDVLPSWLKQLTAAPKLSARPRRCSSFERCSSRP